LINGQNATDGTLKKLEFLRVSASVGWKSGGAHSAILRGILPYRGNRVPGGSLFFTVNLLGRRSDLLATQIRALRDTIRRVRLHAPFDIDAWVVLPDHMHCLWTLPAGDADFPGRWPAIKTAFSKTLPARESRSPAMTSRDAAASATAVGLDGSSPLARRGDRLEQPTAVADRGGAGVLEVLCRQTRQRAIDVVVAEYRFILSEPAPAQPPRDIDARQCDPPQARVEQMDR
jgi:REP element-mobilizing transposase RayT